MVGDDTASGADDVEDDCELLVLRNKALTSNLAFNGVEAGVVAAVEVPETVEAADEADDEVKLPLPLPFCKGLGLASIVPNDAMGLRDSVFAGDGTSDGGEVSGALPLTEPNFMVDAVGQKRSKRRLAPETDRDDRPWLTEPCFAFTATPSL